MTVITMSNYIFNSNTDVYSKIVYAALKKFSNKKGRSFPSRNTLTQLCGISLSTLRKAINTLVETHVLDKKFRYRENKSQTSNLYVLASFMLPGDYYYFKVRGDIFELELSSMETVVYMFLCSCINTENECHPSMNQIAEACGISQTSVKTAIKGLSEKNLILKINQFRVNGGRRNNLYKIITEDNISEKGTNEKESSIMSETNYNAATHEQDDHEQDVSNIVENEEMIQKIESDHDLQNSKYDIGARKERKLVDIKIRGDIFNFKLSKKTLLIYLYLCTHIDPKTGKLPSIQQIAHGCKTTNAKTKKLILELKNEGLIKEDEKNYVKNNTMVNKKTPP